MPGGGSGAATGTGSGSGSGSGSGTGSGSASRLGLRCRFGGGLRRRGWRDDLRGTGQIGAAGCAEVAIERDVRAARRARRPVGLGGGLRLRRLRCDGRRGLRNWFGFRCRLGDRLPCGLGYDCLSRAGHVGAARRAEVAIERDVRAARRARRSFRLGGLRLDHRFRRDHRLGLGNWLRLGLRAMLGLRFGLGSRLLGCHRRCRARRIPAQETAATTAEVRLVGVLVSARRADARHQRRTSKLRGCTLPGTHRNGASTLVNRPLSTGVARSARSPV